MNFTKIYFIVLLAFLTACTTTDNSSRHKSGLTARDAIELSENMAPKSVPGLFSLTVKASGRINGIIYLNTELDYRDRRNVSIVLLPEYQKAFIDEYGVEADILLMNKNIMVNSAAQQRKITFTTNDKYYFQTHIPVKNMKQIRFCVKCT